MNKRVFYKVCILHDVLGSGTCIVPEESYKKIMFSELKPLRIEYIDDQNKPCHFVYNEGVEEFMKDLGVELYDQYTISTVTGIPVESLPEYPFWGNGNCALIPQVLSEIIRYEGISGNK